MDLNITRILSAAQSADISETMNNTSPFSERILLALEITILGLFTVFAVLSIIWGVLSLMRLFMYDIPNRRKAKKELTLGRAHGIIFERSKNGALREGSGGRGNLENDTEKREKRQLILK